MFEHSLYEERPTVEVMGEGDFLANYEIRSWQPSPRLYKILAASAVANLLALLVFAQTSLLTMKGCDSPLVGSVCQVHDTVYLGAVLWGTEREYIDAEYDRTDLGEAEVTFVEVAPENAKLDYPEGYFAIANPQEWAAKVAAANAPLEPGYLAPGIPANVTVTRPYTSGNSILDTPAKPPKRNDNVVSGDLPTGFDNPTTSSNPPISRRKGPKFGGVKAYPTPSPDDTTAKMDEPKVDPLEPITKVTINREALTVYGKEVAAQVDKREIDLAASFKVIAVAELTPDGKMDTSVDKKTKQKKSRVLTGEGDPKMIDTVTKAIAAIGDSGWLGYLSLEGIKKIRFEFSQDDQKLLVKIFAEEVTPERAATLSSKLGGALNAARAGNELGVVKIGDDELTLLKAAGVSSDGKLVTVNFDLPKAIAQEMINRNVKKAKESEANKIKQKEGQLVGAQPSEPTARR